MTDISFWSQDEIAKKFGQPTMKIGPKPFIIAELSGNHGGDLTKACGLIEAAQKSGCDAVKMQLYKPEDLGDPANNHIYEQSMVKEHWLGPLFDCARCHGVPLFFSVFAPWAIERLRQYDCPAYKLASPESTRLTNYEELTAAIRATGKIFMASSGRADYPMMWSLFPDVFFYCIAGYPAALKDDDIEFYHLLWPSYGRAFSDHTTTLQAPLAMIAAGARVIEKHFKIDEQCVDAAFSFNPEQMANLCRIAHR